MSDTPENEVYEEQESPQGYSEGRGLGYGNYADRSSHAPGSDPEGQQQQQEQQVEQLQQQDKQEQQQGPESQP